MNKHHSASRQNLKTARKAKGLTQKQTADLLGVTLNYYQKIEDGSRMGNYDIWDRLEDITEIHQRKLREISDIHPGQEENQQGLKKYPRYG